MTTNDGINLRNQTNAQRSTGPRTPEGKQTSSGNALKDGLYAKNAFLASEDRDEYLSFSQDYVADLQPLGRPQEELVQSIADCFWRLRRIRSAEANQMENVTILISKDTVQAAAAVRLLEAIGRHETRIHNQAIKSMKQLAELQKQPAKPTEAREKAPAPTPIQPKENKVQAAASGFVPASYSSIEAFRASDDRAARVKKMLQTCEEEEKYERWLKQAKA
jgi:hypothetical protein